MLDDSFVLTTETSVLFIKTSEPLRCHIILEIANPTKLQLRVSVLLKSTIILLGDMEDTSKVSERIRYGRITTTVNLKNNNNVLLVK